MHLRLPVTTANTYMSKTTEQTKKTPAAKRVELGPTMSGSEILVACLEREGVDTIFAYPGGASMEIHQALTRCKKIRTVLPRHEQGGAFAADGYGRVTGRAGVCMATSGPGATNLVSGIADAYMDSVPLIAITGQVPQAMIGKGAFQETDIYGMTLPVVKHSYLITDINDIPRIVKEAFHIAQTGRPGPVLIDLPKNVQQARTQPVFPKEVNLRGYQPRPAGERPGTQRDHRADREVGPPGALRRRRHHHRQRERGTAAVCRGGADPGDHHHHGLRRISGDASAVAALAGHARRGLRELGGERRVRAAQEPDRPDEADRARSRFAAGLWRALRRPRDGQGG